MKISLFLLIAIFLVLYIIPLGVRPLAIPDETRYAEIPREILETGEWVVPKLNGLRYFEKPVLSYWISAGALYLFGENSFSVRLPSALAVGVSALLIFYIVRKFGDGDLAAMFTAAAFLTCFEVFGVGTFCVTDSVLSMFTTATFVFFFFAWQENVSTRKKKLFLALAGICCGLAFLTKGFIAFIVPCVVIIPFILWMRQWRKLFAFCWLPLTIAVLVALPWALAIHWKEAGFWEYFFWQEHIQRFLNPESGQHHEPVWYFIPVIIGGALPWSIWIPNAVSGLKTVQFKDSFIKFAICWLVFPFVFFSASGGKLSTYILPCFPPLIILVVMGFLRWHALPGKEKKFTGNLYTSAIIMVIVTIALIFAQTGPFESLKIYHSGEAKKWMLLVIAFLAYAVFLVFAGREKDTNRRLTHCFLAALAVMFCTHFVVPNQIKTGKMPGEFLMLNSIQIHPDTILVSDNYLAPALCWFYKRSDVYLLGRPGEFDYGLSYDDAKYRLVAVENFPNFIEQHSEGSKVLLITRKGRYDDYQKILPKPINTVSDCGFVIAEFTPSRN